jgi:two-component system CheB/CheR fusion protein
MEVSEMTSDNPRPPSENASTGGHPSYYVGIGASAGGLEAIEAFLKNLPSRNSLTFIVVQHLSPDYKSLMAELLSKRTQMPVHRAENGMRVEAGHIYLIPPKKKLTIFHAKLVLSDLERSRSGIFLPIDIFLRSLAEDQGERAVGIILSGTGSDGMRGVRAIKEAGGMVMVQDEATAKFDGMPRSAISTGLADFVLPPEEMPHQLLAFARHPGKSRSERSAAILTDEDGLTRIFSQLRDRHKIDFTYYKPTTVGRRIERRMMINGIDTLREYVKYLESYPGELSILYRELLIGVTSFFRDPEAFDLLATRYLPALFEKKQKTPLRIWVAGCSTGEEAYTVAMVSRDCMERTGQNLDIKLFATDVDNDAIAYAGNGLYPESIAADIAPHYLSRYFYRRDDNFKISRDIREMVVFAQHNLIKDPPFTNIDLISCRNLLIYLQPVLQQKVLDYFEFSLNPKGLLFLGSSETTGELADCFEPLDHRWKIYRSTGNGRECRPDREFVQARFRPTPLVQPPGMERAKTTMQSREEERLLGRLLETLADDYAPLTMVVNEQLELLHVLGDATGILRYASGRVVNDISKIAIKELSIPLATGIPKAFKGKAEVRYANIRIKREDKTQLFNMRIVPLHQKRGQVALSAIFIEKAERYKCLAVEQDTDAYDLDKEAAQRIQDLEHELQFTRENLQSTIEELETSNEELQATNEELMASNEELQSTNEELQSVNEELHTVNAEHQRKLMEATELNNDIRNFTEGSEVGIMFLDENLELRRFTPQITRIFDLAENDIGRSLIHFSHCLDEVDPLAAIEHVHSTGRRFEKEVRTTAGRWYLMRIVPYLIGSGTFSGFVLTFVDIDELKRSQHSLRQSEEALQQSESKFKLLAENILKDTFEKTTVGIAMINEKGYAVESNTALKSILGYNDEELRSMPFQSIAHPDDQSADLEIQQQIAAGLRDFYHLRKRIISKGGNTIPVNCTVIVIRDCEGKMRQTIQLVEKITEQEPAAA